MYRKDKKREFYTEKAKTEGYPARSVYKLQEIDKKYYIFKKGDKVLDLGCAPGSWLAYISEKIGDKGKVVGMDISELEIVLKNNMVFVRKDAMALSEADIVEMGMVFNSVVSDMAPFTSGVKITDVERSLELAEKAYEIAESVLKKGGNFICKIFESNGTEDFIKRIRADFEFLKKFRPVAVAKNSREFYLIGKGFKINLISN